MTTLTSISDTIYNHPGRKGSRIPSDSMIVHIPIDVTADLGVAMKRVRAKRIAKYKQLFSNRVEEKSFQMEEQEEEEDKEEDEEDEMKLETPKSGVENGHKSKGLTKETKKDDLNLDSIGSEVRREQFSSIVDYLEAKYARGIMIHDLDERIRKKKKQNNGGDDLSVLSDSEAGSCYSEDSDNFIDDSDLRTDIAHQILASSAFGTTKIEAEAARTKAQDDESIGADDHAFFVNVGDLEMEDDWNYDLDEDIDWMNSTKRSKGKKRKRIAKEHSAVKSPSKEKKKVIHKETNHVEKKKQKKEKEESSKKSIAKEKEKKEKEKDGEKASAPVKESNKDDDVSHVTKSENSAVIEASKKEAANLKRKVERLFKKCVEEIEKLTKEHLPRKIKGGGTSKCQVVVPEGKASGDELQIGNPHIPGQKLKVKIPKNKVPGDKFTVAVPLPEVESSSTAENKLSKECIDALDKYSMTFDDWCQAEAKYKSLVPKKKGSEKFKVGVERLKKFDKLVSAFPNNLEVPIEPAFLRLLVRRKRQSQSKRKSMGSSAPNGSPNKQQGKDDKTMTLTLPYLSEVFPTITYNKADFVGS
mmetsp:Transcript_16727/g.31696  ORF Transcript_16727/g.31696 Transcript_16727/m.31696 type:complete len:585 (+) Transcript_16727:80-1834(+)|eukprot:CAMPEP_0176491442 /NCGR_PEP_ID=MMETSP0200_2-20121128/8434_1 /TAXON_ID=947934 /ORGANISM="Chaetoceros sp., Strain GSL56" /LENGTH=584 /DNA_ID=CAMNT_0017888871 /DNA_START=37 /DNA_END=1791 /DNA_ORIENTATION=+